MHAYPAHVFTPRVLSTLLSLALFSLLMALPAAAASAGRPAAPDTGADHRAAPVITPEFADRLRLEGITGTPDMGEFDVGGYDRAVRIETPFGTYKSWEKTIPTPYRRFQPQPQYTLRDTYKTRIGGFTRGRLFGPDQIGSIQAEYGVHFTNGTGNSLLEALMITKKYGLQYFFYAPDLGRDALVGDEEGELAEAAGLGAAEAPNSRYDLAFVKEDYPQYAKLYAEELNYMKTRLDEFSALFAREGGLYPENYRDDPNFFWALFTQGDLRPVDFFLRNVVKDYHRVNAEFKARYGFDLPLEMDVNTPEQKARRMKMWRWIREKFTEVAAVKAKLFREIISGRGTVATNVHFEEIVDYERYGEVFDYPGAAIRPMLSNRKLAWEYIIGYGTRLVADLTGKVPMISARINVPGSGARIIPTPATIEYWYSQAIQNGTVGFYLWMNDYPGHAGGYRGPFMGNPDPSTLPLERWRTSLNIARKLHRTNVFVPPHGETAILVPLDSAALGNYGWKRTFSAYIELTRAGVWSNFISDQEILEGTKPLAQYKTVYVPFMDFAERKVAEALLEYARGGGTVVSCDPRIFEYDLDGRSSVAFRRELFGVSSVRPRPAAGPARLAGTYAGIEFKPHGESYLIETDPGTSVIGIHPDRTPAAVEKRHGSGRAVLFASTLADIYLHEGKDGFVEDTGRYDFYKRVENQCGVEDRSWIWDVNFHNVDQLTGTSQAKHPAPIESIQFKKYLNPEGGAPPTTMVTDIDPLTAANRPDRGRNRSSGN